MDNYGAVLQTALDRHEGIFRATGRTTRMLNELRDGDRVVVGNMQLARVLRKEIQSRGLSVDCVVIPVEKAQDVMSLTLIEGRTHFEHSWLFEYYRNALAEANQGLALMQHAHRGTPPGKAPYQG